MVDIHSVLWKKVMVKAGIFIQLFATKSLSNRKNNEI